MPDADSPREGVAVRPATEDDLPVVSTLAAELVRMHRRVDPARFLLVDRVEEGYRRWLAHEIGRRGAVVLVACRGPHVVGYAYGTMESRDWNLLLDAHGAVHDVFVADAERRNGIGRRLVEAMVGALEQRGAERIVLSTMVGNAAAQQLFRACGFRPTMLEMTR